MWLEWIWPALGHRSNHVARVVRLFVWSWGESCGAICRHDAANLNYCRSPRRCWGCVVWAVAGGTRAPCQPVECPAYNTDHWNLRMDQKEKKKYAVNAKMFAQKKRENHECCARLGISNLYIVLSTAIRIIWLFCVYYIPWIDIKYSQSMLHDIKMGHTSLQRE